MSRQDTRKPGANRALGVILVLPILIWLAIMFLYPFLNTFYTSFTNMKLLGSKYQFVGLETYMALLKNSEFTIAVVNTVVWTVGSLIFQLLFGVAAALLLNPDFPGCRFFRTWIIIPWAIPFSVIAVIARWMLSSTFGVVNYSLMEMGLIAEPINFLGSTQFAMLSTLVVNVWKWFPFMAVNFLAVLQGIPADLYEAARMDGCSRFQEFVHIQLPELAGPCSTTALLMSFWNFNTFGLIWLLTAGGPGTATTTLPIMVYTTAFRSFRMGQASALSVMMFLVLLAYSIVYKRVAKNNADYA